MSNISDERLIVAVVKDGDSDALEKLKERLISGQHGIRATLNRSPISDDEKNMIEEHIVETLFTDLYGHGFTQSIRIYGFRYAKNVVIQYRDQKEYKLSNLESTKEKAIPSLSDLTEIPKHPPLEKIDLEIRTLVSLLNQFSHIRTRGSSCSGHPNRDVWEEYGGYIGISSYGKGNPRKTLDFLIGLLMRLDNSDISANITYLPDALQIKQDTNNNATSTESIRDQYKQVDAEKLYYSGEPIVIIGVSYRFYVCESEEKHSLGIWKQLILCIQELIPEDEELRIKVDTPEMAMELLQKTLRRLPFLFSAALTTSEEGYPGIVLNSKADLAVSQWFSTLANRLHERLKAAGYVGVSDTERNPQFAEKWSFTLQPFLNQELIPLPHLLKTQWEPRTREDHLKIWKLLENTVTELLKHEEVNTHATNY